MVFKQGILCKSVLIVNRVRTACTIEFICLMKFVVLHVYKSKDYNVNFLNCNCQ